MPNIVASPWKRALDRASSGGSRRRLHDYQNRTIAQTNVAVCYLSRCVTSCPIIVAFRNLLIELQMNPRLVLPDCLSSVSLDALKADILSSSVTGGPSISALSAGGASMERRYIRQGGAENKGCSSVNGHSLIPKLRLNFRAQPQGTRSYSTLSHLGMSRVRSTANVRGLPILQQRRSLFGGVSHTLLAQKENSANSNPNSANAQNSFYQALLRANMPAIVVERYRNGHFASNAVTEQLFLKALQRVEGVDSVPAMDAQSPAQSQNQVLSPEHRQAIGQVIAARNYDGQFGVPTKQSGTGAKESPIYVVVEESWGIAALRWVKFLFYFAFFGYICFMGFTFALELMASVKNIRGPKNSEAQPQQQKVRFSDVHGCDEAKEELQEVVDFLLNPDQFSSLGGKLPKGVLLVGPPGTGKTLLARAVAGEAGVPFFYMSGSEFDEVYVGVGAKRVRDLFTQARAKAPAIIFIDELDAIGAKRNERDAAYVKQTLNQLLTELDGFSQTSGVIVLAATNFPQLLDKALTRPGRFDRKVVVGLPDVRGRMDILNHHMKNIMASADVDVAVIARGTPGFSGADLENLVNQAAVHAGRNHSAKVGPKDFDWAKDKIMMGAEARSRIIQDKDKLLTAYHEAGHALVAYFSPSSTPLYKITIVPRGMALGVTHFLPEMDMVSRNYTEYLADIDVSMGGKAAEELVFGADKVTSGISAVSFFFFVLRLINYFAMSSCIADVFVFQYRTFNKQPRPPSLSSPGSGIPRN